MKFSAYPWRSAATFLHVALLCGIAPLASGQGTSGDDSAPNDTAHAAAALLANRCGVCHGPESDNRKAARAWSDARDLASTVADEELIVPGSPDDSYLYTLVEDGDMPPPDSDEPQLTGNERAVLASWIQAGAPLPVAEPDPVPEADPIDDTAGAAAAPLHWMKQPWPKWVGRFHPTVVHFPIALLSVAFLAELLAKLLRKPELLHAATFSYTLGALGTIPAATFGWLLAESAAHHGDEVDYHRWMGVTVASVAILGMTVFYRRPGVRLPLLALLAVLVGITGHLGGGLSYGSDWLTPPF